VKAKKNDITIWEVKKEKRNEQNEKRDCCSSLSSSITDFDGWHGECSRYLVLLGF
jgi:hypothetical protein